MNRDYIGAGCGLPTDGMIGVIGLMAPEEGILLDPMYSGKGMVCLIELIRKVKYQKYENIVILNTSCSRGLVANSKTFST